jgi:hypothetical protein
LVLEGICGLADGLQDRIEGGPGALRAKQRAERLCDLHQSQELGGIGGALNSVEDGA